MKNSRKSKRRNRFQADPEEQVALQDFLADQGVTDWDFVILGDGSGSNWNREAGWASVSIERLTLERLVWWGAMNKSTVNFAEIMAYLQPLNWFQAREQERRSRGRNNRFYDVYIFTDSEYCRQVGAGDSVAVKKNAAPWAGFDVLRAHGFMLHWRYIPRESVALNHYCDRLARLARLLVRKYNVQDRLEAEAEAAGAPQTVYDINPSTGDE